MIEQIRYMIDIRRDALEQKKTVLQPLDKYGNSDYKKEPLVFNTRTEAIAHQKANKNILFIAYFGDNL
jgi:hypothetical protein